MYFPSQLTQKKLRDIYFRTNKFSRKGELYLLRAKNDPSESSDKTSIKRTERNLIIPLKTVRKIGITYNLYICLNIFLYI